MFYEFDSKKVELKNPDKVFWPKEGYTKQDLAEYYISVAEYILPYLKDRPENLNRFPNGIEKKHFYHKNLSEVGPDWLKKQEIYSPSNDIVEKYLVCNDLASLIYMVNLGCIEINPWSSRTFDLEKPDWAIIDLDPEGTEFEEVKTTAKRFWDLLKKIGAKSFLKTSGATGLHIYIPFEADYSYEQIKNLSYLMAVVIHRELPDITSLERLPEKRQGKIYLDFLQNNKGQTLAAPYSVRPRVSAPVSTPLKWEELNSDFSPNDFTIQNALKRIKKEGDIFSGVLNTKNDLKAIFQNLSEFL